MSTCIYYMWHLEGMSLQAKWLKSQLLTDATPYIALQEAASRPIQFDTSYTTKYKEIQSDK